MKNFHYISSVLCSFLSMIVWFIADNDMWVILGFMCMLLAIIFFLFAVIEERNDEIKLLKEKIYKS